MTNYWKVAPQVIGETLQEETIILNLETGIYYACQATGSLIWNLLKEGTSIEQTTLHFESTADLKVNITHFLQQLQNEELIVKMKDPKVEMPTIAQVVPFVPPILEKHTDMQDFLELDPIHEVYHIEQNQ
ncbi:MAG: PqqD family protein [Bacteroidota bacterium]